MAIDAATPPGPLTRRLRRAWQRFANGLPVHDVRPLVIASWRRSRDAGVEPLAPALPPVVADPDDVSAAWLAQPAAHAVEDVRLGLAVANDSSRHLFAVSDADGLLVSVKGDPRIVRAAAEVNFCEGASWSEQSAGTNAVGTALVEDHAVQIFAAEHFKEAVHAWTGAAAPVHDPDTGTLLGSIELTGPLDAAHPHSLAAAAATARAIELELSCRLQHEQERLRYRYGSTIDSGHGPRALVTSTGAVLLANPRGWLAGHRVVPPSGGGELVLPSGTRAVAEPVGHSEAFLLRPCETGRNAARRLVSLSLLGRERAQVEVEGRTVELSRRHSEILVVLWTNPDGLTGEELARRVYGAAARCDTARVEVHRLRKALGPWIAGEPYRLSADVLCDVVSVTSLLESGAAKAAIDAYAGPLLPRSKAPGVVRERETLETWVRHAVMTAGDEDALWSWVQSPSGRHDAPACRRLLGGLAFHDPRRSLVAARLSSLRGG